MAMQTIRYQEVLSVWLSFIHSHKS